MRGLTLLVLLFPLTCMGQWLRIDARKDAPTRPVGPVSRDVAEEYARSLQSYERSAMIQAAFFHSDPATVVKCLTADSRSVLLFVGKGQGELFHHALVEGMNRRLPDLPTALKAVVKDQGRTSEALEAIGMMAMPVYEAPLRVALGHPSARVAVSAAVALARGGQYDQAIRGALLRFRGSPRPRVMPDELPFRNREAVATLLRHGEAKSVEQMRALLAPLGTDARYLYHGVALLRYGRECLRQIVADESLYHGLRTWAMKELSGVGDAGAIPALRIAVMDRQPWVRAAAATALADLGAKQALPDLKRALMLPGNPNSGRGYSGTISDAIARLEGKYILPPRSGR